LNDILTGMGRDPVMGARLAARKAVEVNPPSAHEAVRGGPASPDRQSLQGN
jgi:hypothetical protein